MTVTLDRPPATGTSMTPPVRTVDLVLVPFDETTYGVDIPDHRGERFARGAFSDLVASRDPAQWAHIRLTDSHLDGPERRPVARAIALFETKAGLLGTFRFFNTPEGRSAFENVREGTYGGASIEFIERESRTIAGQIREVTRATLAAVSLVDNPAYDGAIIFGLHENDHPVRLAVPDHRPPTSKSRTLPLATAPVTSTPTSRPPHTPPRVTRTTAELLIPPRTPAQIRADDDARLQREVYLEAREGGAWNAKARVMVARARRRGVSAAELHVIWNIHADTW